MIFSPYLWVFAPKISPNIIMSPLEPILQSTERNMWGENEGNHPFIKSCILQSMVLHQLTDNHFVRDSAKSRQDGSFDLLFPVE